MDADEGGARMIQTQKERGTPSFVSAGNWPTARRAPVSSSSSIDATHRLVIGKRAVMELGKPLLLQIGVCNA